MQRDDDLPGTADDPRFGELVAGIARDDPRFVRRVSAPPRRRIAATELSIGVGLLVTLLVGVVPLVLGLQLGLTSLLALGGAACVVLPVLIPLLVHRTLRRARPLWR